MDRIAVPTFILNAANDPFIRILPETRGKILSNPHITFVETEDGGHCSYLAEANGSSDGRWAESQVVEFLRVKFSKNSRGRQSVLPARRGRAKLDALSYTITADEVPAVDPRRHRPAGAPHLLSAEPVSQLRPTDYVNDFAHVLDQTTIAQLDNICQQLDQKAHAQIAVVTINSLDGADIESYAVALYKQWGIGSKATDHGVLILLAVQDHKYRIEVGYGLEPILTDGKVGGFGREAVPLLRQNDYNGAVSLMTSRVADVIAQDAGIELTGDRPQFTIAPRARPRRGLSGKQLLILGVILLIIMFTPLRSVLFWILLSGLGGGGGGGYGAVVADSAAVAAASADSAVAVPAAAAPAEAGS